MAETISYISLQFKRILCEAGNSSSMRDVDTVKSKEVVMNKFHTFL